MISLFERVWNYSRGLEEPIAYSPLTRFLHRWMPVTKAIMAAPEPVANMCNYLQQWPVVSEKFVHFSVAPGSRLL
jgi:hypothetical protein